MAIKTFTAGSVLTSSDTNTFLANAGLVFVKSQTVGTAVSSVSVSSAFSADYDNYLVTYNGGTTSVSTNLNIQLTGLTTANTYYSGIVFVNIASAAAGAASTNGTLAQIGYVGFGTTTDARAMVTIMNPFLAKPTQFSFAALDPTGAIYPWNGGGIQTSSTSVTGFSLRCDSGTMTGGVITVYGYRKA